jgi:hypothetical protein
MYALARLVAGPAPSARVEFYNSGGLQQLQALFGSSSGASTRVKTRAVNLVSDLIGGSAAGGAWCLYVFFVTLSLQASTVYLGLLVFCHTVCQRRWAAMSRWRHALLTVLCDAVMLLPCCPTEMTANGDDTSLETWNESAMSLFAAAALDLLQQSEALDIKEKALFAMRTLLVRRGPAGGAALAHEGAEAVLREVLIELDLLADKYSQQAQALAAAAAGGDAGSLGQAKEGSETAGVLDDEEGADPAVAEGHAQYAQYIGHLCADVLHQLSVHHEEL